MRVSDHRFVARLAATQDHFTVPSRYLLWMLCRTQLGLCLVVESPSRKRLGYALGLFTKRSGDAIFLWQLAVTRGAQRVGAGWALVSHLRDWASRRRVSEIRFTMIPSSPAYHWVRDAVESLLNQRLEVLSRVPREVNDLERECRIRLFSQLH